MTIKLDPNLHVSNSWDNPGAPYYAEIDEIGGNEANVDTMDGISTSPPPSTTQEQVFGFETATVQSNGTSVTIHVHGFTGSSVQLDVDLSLDGGATWQGVQNVIPTATGTETWYTHEYTGLTVDQSAIDNLQVKLIANNVGPGGGVTVNALYVSTDATDSSGSAVSFAFDHYYGQLMSGDA